MALPWINATDKMVGKGHAVLGDTLNAALRTLLQKIGIDPDVPFAGLRGKVFNPMAYGAVGDGSADDRTALADADTASGGSVLHLPTGKVFRANSNITLNAKVVEFDAGAMLKPASGVTITILGTVRAEHHKIFDLSLGGTISFTGNKGAPRYSPFWWGTVADGVTDDQPALQAFIDAIPAGGRGYVPAGTNFAIANRWTWTGKDGVIVVAESDPRGFIPSLPGYATLTWRGAAGGTMMGFDRCRFCHISGFYFDNAYTSGAPGADICIDIDGYGETGLDGKPGMVGAATLVANTAVASATSTGLTAVGSPGWTVNQWPSVGAVVSIVSGTGAGQDRYIASNTAGSLTLYAPNWTVTPDATSVFKIMQPINQGIGTQCRISHCSFSNLNGASSTFTAIAIARFININNEYHVIEHCNLFGGYGHAKNFNYGYQTTNGSTAVTYTGNFGSVADGTRIRIAGAGPSGGVLDTTVSSVAGTTGVLAVPASATVTNVFGITGQCLGVGISINAQNAKSIKIRDCNFTELNFGIWLGAGSFHSENNSWAGCEIDMQVGSATEPCTDSHAHSENGRRHINFTNSAPMTVTGGRFDLSLCEPGHGYFESVPAVNLTMIGCTAENPNKLGEHGCWLFKPQNPNYGVINGLSIINCVFGGAGSWFNGGFGDEYISIINGVDDVSQGSGSFMGATTFRANTKGAVGAGDFGQVIRSIAGTTSLHGTGSFGGHGIVSEIWGAGPSGIIFADFLAYAYRVRAAFRAILGGDNNGPGTAGIDTGIEVVMPTYNVGQTDEARGVRITSPALTGGSTLRSSRALIIENQTTTGVAGANAIEQRGVNDGNVIAGPIYGGVRTAKLTAPTNGLVTPVGAAGATTYQYLVVPIDGQGRRGPASAMFQTTTGNATLNSTNYNMLAWTRTPGAVKYDILGRAGLTTASVALGVVDTFYKDTGAGTSAYTLGVTTTTADSVLDGVVLHGSGQSVKASYTGGLAGGSTYNPDASAVEEHRMMMNGALTVGDATWRGSATIPDGAHLILTFQNNSGGSQTPAFSAQYKVGTVPALAATKEMTAELTYDSTLSKWRLIGQFSPNL